ncbi:hypothetical protein CATRI_10615 [Corynebacterium atrinae]|nr:type IV toxin-antitoxin system AbiEi family antitoxin domain-containing protein [Corynebacterium atrinae]WJY64184.1 hypothetical protein CATRI_10615 [Corynebacterium atrinae]
MRDHGWPPGKDYYTTQELRAHGFSEYVLTRLVKEGRLSRIVRGIYTHVAVTGQLVLEAINEHKPHVVFSGKTVAELYLGKEITLPLHAVVERGSSKAQSPVVKVRERKKVDVRMMANVRVVSALAAAGDAAGMEMARELLEVRYASKKGREDFERDRHAMRRFPKKIARAVAAAAVGLIRGRSAGYSASCRRGAVGDSRGMRSWGRIALMGWITRRGWWWRSMGLSITVPTIGRTTRRICGS